MTAVSKEINYEEEMLAPTITLCPVLSTSMSTFQEAEESFLSLEQMFLNFTHKYAENKYGVHASDPHYSSQCLNQCIFTEQ